MITWTTSLENKIQHCVLFSIDSSGALLSLELGWLLTWCCSHECKLKANVVGNNSLRLSGTINPFSMAKIDRAKVHRY